MTVAAELRNRVPSEIGPIAGPDLIARAPGLPKTQSGRIMRRIVRKIAENGCGTPSCTASGDTATLADPTVVESLVGNRQKR